MSWISCKTRIHIRSSRAKMLARCPFRGLFSFLLPTGRLGCQAMRRTEAKAHAVKGGRQEPSQSVQVLGEFRRGGCRVRCAFKLPLGRRPFDSRLARLPVPEARNKKQSFSPLCTKSLSTHNLRSTNEK